MLCPKGTLRFTRTSVVEWQDRSDLRRTTRRRPASFHIIGLGTSLSVDDMEAARRGAPPGNRNRGGDTNPIGEDSPSLHGRWLGSQKKKGGDSVRKIIKLDTGTRWGVKDVSKVGPRRATSKGGVPPHERTAARKGGAGTREEPGPFRSNSLHASGNQRWIQKKDDNMGDATGCRHQSDRAPRGHSRRANKKGTREIKGSRSANHHMQNSEGVAGEGGPQHKTDKPRLQTGAGSRGQSCGATHQGLEKRRSGTKRGKKEHRQKR